MALTLLREDPRNLKTSDRGRAFITDWEGLRLHAYQDSAGIWTIGVGHTGPDVVRGKAITHQQADFLLRKDLQEAEAEIHALVRVPLNQYEFDALVSWEFNTGGLRGSTLLKRLNAGLYDKVDDEMRRWDKATVGGKKTVLRGLKARRLSESELWSVGDYRTRNETMPYWETNTVPNEPVSRETEKPLAKRRTVQGATATSIGVAGATLTETATSLNYGLQVGPILQLLFVALALTGAGLTVYSAVKGSQESDE